MVEINENTTITKQPASNNQQAALSKQTKKDTAGAKDNTQKANQKQKKTSTKQNNNKQSKAKQAHTHTAAHTHTQQIIQRIKIRHHIFRVK